MGIKKHKYPAPHPWLWVHKIDRQVCGSQGWSLVPEVHLPPSTDGKMRPLKRKIIPSYDNPKFLSEDALTEEEPGIEEKRNQPTLTVSTLLLQSSYE